MAVLLASLLHVFALPGPAAPAGAAPAPARSGRADVYTAPASVLVPSAGSTFSLDVTVDPRSVNVGIDAAAARVAFDPAALEVTGVSGGGVLDTELTRTVDNGAGTLYYAAGKLGGSWPTSSFVLANVQFRVKTAPTSGLAVTLVSGGRNATDVAADGASVLDGVRGTTISFGTPTASGGTTSSSTGGSTGSSGSGGGGGGGSSRRTSPAPAPAPLASAPAAATLPPASAPTTAPGAVVPASGASGATLASFPAGAVPPLPSAVDVGASAVGAPFQQFYAERQGLRVLGNTLVPSRQENGFLVQYFEKGRIEEHSDEPNAAWRLQYGLLVDELVAAGAGLPVGGDASTLTYATIQQLTQPGGRVAPPDGFTGGTATLPDGAVFVPFSAALAPGPGHVVPANFWAYVNDAALFPGGWLHDVGLPITEPVEAVVDKGPDKGRRIVVQAFQRTVLTYDPLNPPDYLVERANVGTDYARAFPGKFGA
jgi:hypothetical protein